MSIRSARVSGRREPGRFALGWLAGAWLLPGICFAHLLPAQQATIHVVDNSAYIVVAAPLSAFAALSAVGSHLTTAQLSEHRGAIANEFNARWQLTDGPAVGRPLFTWVLNPETDGVPREGSSYVVVMQRVLFDRPPAHPVLSTTLFGRGAGEDHLTLRVTRGEDVQIIVLCSSHDRYELFPGAWATFAAFVGVGIDHILLGGDHLLFLLTIVTAAAGLRQWLTVITSFTLAHSITLSLAVTGVLHIAPAIVEPAIAASIVLMAAGNLLAIRAWDRWRIAVVFACGLLHGLGFASALMELGVDASHRVATLAGFNAGVECGQLLFLGALLAVLGIARHCLPARIASLAPRAAAACAVTCGAALLWLRLSPALTALN